MLMDLVPEGFVQGELDWGDTTQTNPSAHPEAPTRGRSRVMGAMDTLNSRYGRGTVKLASGGTEHGHGLHPGATQPGWKMKQERRTPRYTTHWDELAVVKG
jgi:DNA polymerase V